ncbi:hypothetical protein [Pyrobaculum islandicum]|uniref:hypothetical protein n=1 Tax=Pyrobaculum islandicum TaxID=2277 RepID=UPI001432E4D2|nr:hypothetical protein [Pyrobaculum islandicum]
MKFAIGIVLNITAFTLAVLCQWPIAAILFYVASLVLIMPRREKKKEEKVETKREITPEEIKRRPVSAPEV